MGRFRASFLLEDTVGAEDIRTMLSGAPDDTPGSPLAEEEVLEETEENPPETDDTDGGATEEPVEEEGTETVEEEEEEDLSELSDRARQRVETSRRQTQEAREESDRNRQEAERLRQENEAATQRAEAMQVVVDVMRENPGMTFEQVVQSLLNPSAAQAAPLTGPQTLDDFIQEVSSDAAFAGEDDAFIREIAARRFNEIQLQQQLTQTQQMVQGIVGHYQQMMQAAQTQQASQKTAENDNWALSQIDAGITSSKGALLPDERDVLKDDAYRRFFGKYDAMTAAERASADERSVMQQCIKEAVDNGVRLYQKKKAATTPQVKPKSTARFESKGGNAPPTVSEDWGSESDLRAGLRAALAPGDGRA